MSTATLAVPTGRASSSKCKCGRPVDTPFCGHCGAKNEGIPPLAELLSELRSTVAGYQAKIDNPPTEKKGKAAGQSLTVDEQARVVVRATKDRDHYQRYVDALAEIVEGSGGAATGDEAPTPDDPDDV